MREKDIKSYSYMDAGKNTASNKVFIKIRLV